MSKKCTALWREAHLEVKSVKNWRSWSTFGSRDVEKVHAVVARSTFASQNVQNTWVSDHFWKLRCRKSARRCGAKHISKKMHKTRHVGPLLEVEMSKKCTPLWREAHFQVKMYKAHHVRTTFGRCRKSARRCGAKHISKSKCTKHTMYGPLLEDVEKVHAVVARSTFRSQNVQSTPCTDHFWRFRCARDCGPCQKWAKREGFVAFSTTTHCTPIHYTTLQLQLHLHYILLHYTPLHYTALNYTQLHYTTLHYTPLHYTTLHYTTLNYTTTTTTLHSTTLDYTKLHCTTLHYTTFHNTTTTTTQNYTTLTLHSTTLHSTTLHYTTLHYTTLHHTEWHCTTDRQVDR